MTTETELPTHRRGDLQLIAKAKKCFLYVVGVNDSNYLEVTKKQASEVVRRYCGDFIVEMDEHGYAFVAHNHTA